MDGENLEASEGKDNIAMYLRVMTVLSILLIVVSMALLLKVMGQYNEIEQLKQAHAHLQQRYDLKYRQDRNEVELTRHRIRIERIFEDR